MLRFPRRRSRVRPYVQSVAEERFNWLSHGLGLLLVSAGTAALVTAASLYATPWHIVGVSIFGASLVLLYATSTIYHSLRDPRWKRVLQVTDHAVIFLLIAGTYTPFTLVTLRGGWGWSLFGVIWGLAAAGIAFKLFFTGRVEALSTLLYVVMGWLVVVAIVPLVEALAPGDLALLVTGGVAYTVGALFYLWDERVPYFHNVFHLCVLAGSACHYWVVWNVVLPSS